MKILFKNHFQPMLECCELLEDCLRKERYEETLRGEHLPIEEEKRIQSHIDVLIDIRSEVDAVFLQDYKDLSLLFEDKKNGKVTPFRIFFISYLDMEETDWKLQLQRLRRVCEKDRLCLIRAYISNFDEDKDYKNVEDAVLLQDLNATSLSAEDKWELLMKAQDMTAVLDRWEELFIKLLAVLDRYQKEYAEAARQFEDMIENHEELLKELSEFTGMKLDEVLFKSEELLILPAFSGFRSLSFLTQDLNEHGKATLIWGLDILSLLKYKKAGMSVDTICTSLKLLSDKSKFEILCYVSRQCAYGAQIAKELQLTTPTISYHMQALMNAGFIKFRKENNRLYYSLNREYLEEFLEMTKQKLLSNS